MTKSKHIIVLEDEALSRNSFAALLRSAGHDVVVACNALEAEALCAVRTPDVAVIDINLPGLRGDQWAMHLKSIASQIQIIFVSGRPGLAGLDIYGPDAHFLHKPIAPDDLLSAVSQESSVEATAV